MEKLFRTFCRKSLKDSKTVFFFFILALKLRKFYSFLYIYLYIYKKLSPKWKNFNEQKVFLFRFYILYENFSKIGPLMKK